MKSGKNEHTPMINESLNYYIYDYSNTVINKQIISLYEKVFSVSYQTLPLPFTENPCGGPIGVIAILESENRVVGHFATMAIQAYCDNGFCDGRISFGFMVDPDYQGRGIAKKLSQVLFNYLSRTDCSFVIGIPNDNSLYMHQKYMDYYHVKDYQIRIIPNPKKHTRTYRKIESIEEVNNSYQANMIIHSREMLDWHFSKSKYLKYLDDNNDLFICNYYHDTMQLLYWDRSVTKKQIEDFSSFLYDEYNVSAVRTWNVYDWLDNYEAEKRKYHFTIRIINNSIKSKLLNNWFFYPGDCELF